MAELLKEHEVVRHLEDECAAAGSQSAWAAAHGVSHKTVNDVIWSRRAPSKAILTALGLRKVTRYTALRGPA
ncbi:hypothetical protein [Roseococcus pinisoli]|uniref:Uncharacterized protein n=1 Tax=Roseococcus pinisoli TaxID=2835040 RepID=A0ABS5QBY1_9PROT|nr:hypothetical protein [Roseococcus pinisoli]MBS7811191.1 hypothetical protein [Roseococcus pinisoli]